MSTNANTTVRNYVDRNPKKQIDRPTNRQKHTHSDRKRERKKDKEREREREKDPAQPSNTNIDDH